MSLHVVVDRERCIGSGVCTVYAGATFDIDDEGKAIVVAAAPDPPDAIREAVAGCPTGALAYTTDEKGP